MSGNLKVNCSIASITLQLDKLPQSKATHDLLYRLESERAQARKTGFRAGVKRILSSLCKRIDKSSQKKIPRKDLRNKKHGGTGRTNARRKKNGGTGEADLRNKSNGGTGRTDARSKKNGGTGEADLRNKSNGGTGRTDCHSQESADIVDCHELRDFWWNHADNAAVIASCCASHEASVHTFWTAEEWMINMASTATGERVMIVTRGNV